MPRKGYKPTEEHKRRLSEAKQGVTLSAQHKQAIAQGLTGHAVDQTTRAMLSEMFKGKKRGAMPKTTRNDISLGVVETILGGAWTPSHQFDPHYSPKAGIVSYRSYLELNFFLRWDADPDILQYFVEACAIPYQRKDGSTHRYIPDALLLTQEGWKLVEIKPKFRCREWLNRLKARVATAFAKSQGWSFLLLTEQD